MMEAARTSETLINFYQTTRRYNPEDSHLRTHRRENLKSYLTDKKSLSGLSWPSAWGGKSLGTAVLQRCHLHQDLFLTVGYTNAVYVTGCSSIKESNCNSTSDLPVGTNRCSVWQSLPAALFSHRNQFH
jgi:hypothetical protein